MKRFHPDRRYFALMSLFSLSSFGAIFTGDPSWLGYLGFLGFLGFLAPTVSHPQAS